MEVLQYDLIVIGGGPAGYEAAAVGASRGDKVLLVEQDALGGTCLNRGCIPTKCFCRSAQVAADIADAGEFGIRLPEDGRMAVDMQGVVERKNSVVGSLREGVAMLVAGAHVATGTARFADAHTVEVGNLSGLTGSLADGELPQAIMASAQKIIIATGSAPATLPIPGAELTVSSTEMLELRSLPSSLAVIGGGVIGMEFASIFASFGVDVTVVEYCKEILPPFDKDIAKRMRTAMQRRGVKFNLGAEVKSVEAAEGVMKRVNFVAKGKEQSAEAEMVLMAVGRRPVVPQGAEEAGIAVGRRGIEVDSRFQTSVAGVYAVGDCNGQCLLAHAASAQAMLVMGENMDLSVIPSAVFTVPECAMAGMTEEQCKAAEIPFKTGKSFFRANGKALAMGESDGLVKVLVDDNGLLLGCHICGPHAADLVAEAALAMSARLPVASLLGTVHAHPTLSEALVAAIRSAR